MLKKIPNINIKQFYDFQLGNNKNAIKSLKMLSLDNKIKLKIIELKKENKRLKKEFVLAKRKVYQESKIDSNNVNKIKKEWKKIINEQKVISDKKTYDFLKNEYKNIKINKKAIQNKKYQKVYGTSIGRTRKERINFLIKILVIILLLIAFLTPFWMVISFSTKTNIEAANTSKFASFIPSTGIGAKDNYDLAVKNLDIWNSIFITLILTIVSNVLILFFAAMAAWQLVRSDKWWSKILFYIFVAAMILPFQSIMIPLISQMQKLKLRNTIIGTIISYVGFGMALSIFMMHGFLKTIPKALEESAAISGMGPFRIFIKIVLPLLKNTFITILVLNIMWIWNDYLLPSLMLNDQYSYQTLQVRLVDRLVSDTSSDLKALSAGIVVLIIPPIIYFTMSQKRMISGITDGSIK